MQTNRFTSRRSFLRHFAGVASAATASLTLPRSLWADPTQIASRVEDASDSHPLSPAIQKAFASLQSLDDVKSYTALLTKQEKFGRNLVKSRIELKLREEPFSVYLKFLEPMAGREVIYVNGQNNNQLQAHDAGFRALFGTVSLEPEGSMAMDGNRHPITLIGMRKLAEVVLDQWLDELKLTGVTVNMFPNTRLGNTSCEMIETSYARPQAGVKFQMTRLYIDSKHGYPVRVQQYDFPDRRERNPSLAEEYTYSDLKTDVDLQDIDFSVKNPRYAF
ncbi:MAG: DUF1571 domain-containing protein [Planctomycetaceae bacterium]|nr:DUF1571 domain-containing protein [Planctomycetaceae bacterium]